MWETGAVQLTRTDKEVTTGDFFEEQRHVIATHNRVGVDNFVRSKDLSGALADKVGPFVAVDYGWAAIDHLEFYLTAQGFAQADRNFLNPSNHLLPNFRQKRADGAFQDNFWRDNV